MPTPLLLFCRTRVYQKLSGQCWRLRSLRKTRRRMQHCNGRCAWDLLLPSPCSPWLSITALPTKATSSRLTLYNCHTSCAYLSWPFSNQDLLKECQNFMVVLITHPQMEDSLYILLPSIPHRTLSCARQILKPYEVQHAMKRRKRHRRYERRGKRF